MHPYTCQSFHPFIVPSTHQPESGDKQTFRSLPLTFSLIHSLIQSFTHLLIYSLTHSIIHSFVHSFTHSFNRSFVRSFVHSLIHSFIHSIVGCTLLFILINHNKMIDCLQFNFICWVVVANLLLLICPRSGVLRFPKIEIDIVDGWSYGCQNK